MFLTAKEFLGFLFILIFTSKTEAQNRGAGPCPDVATQRDFNASDFAGRWFEYARTPRTAEAFGKCIFFEYIPPIDGRITINRRKISEITNEEDLHSAQATVLSPGQAISPDFYDYRVVETDYKNFAVIYACKNQALSTFHLDQSWILTRAPIPGEEYIKMAYRTIKENKMETYNLLKTEQKRCPPPPEGKLPTNL